jgi:hypothetical protein
MATLQEVGLKQQVLANNASSDSSQISPQVGDERVPRILFRLGHYQHSVHIKWARDFRLIIQRFLVVLLLSSVQSSTPTPPPASTSSRRIDDDDLFFVAIEVVDCDCFGEAEARPYRLCTLAIHASEGPFERLYQTMNRIRSRKVKVRIKISQYPSSLP